MKVKSLVDQQDVRKGVVYEAVQVQDNDWMGVDVIDDRGEEWYLTPEEYEVIEP